MPDRDGSPSNVRVRQGRNPVSVALACGAAAMCVPPALDASMTPTSLGGTFPHYLIGAWFALLFAGAVVYLSGVLPAPVEKLDQTTGRLVIGRLLRERIGCFAVGWQLVSLAGGVAGTGLHGVPIALLLLGLSCGPGWRIRQTFVDVKALRVWSDEDPGEGAA